MSADRSDQTTTRMTTGAGTGTVAALSLVVAVVLGDSGVVTLALPEILRDFGADVTEVAWVLMAFNLVLALAAVPAARVCVRKDPAVATAAGLFGFAAATTACAVAPSLGVLIAARALQAVGGAFVLVGSLELLVEATGAERAGAGRWAAAGVAGAALGPVTGGLLTSAFSWRSIFVVQIPVVLLALPATIALRGRVVRRRATPSTAPDRPHVLANLALALLSAALTRALFLPRAADRRGLAPLARGGGGRRHGGGGGPGGGTVVPGPARRDSGGGGGRVGADRRRPDRAGVAAGRGARLDDRAAGAGRPRARALDRLAHRGRAARPDPQAIHGGWTIAARHAGGGGGPGDPPPIFTADLTHAESPAKEAVASLVLDSPLPASTKLDLADGLGRQLVAERGRVPDLRPAFKNLHVPAAQAATAASLEVSLVDQLDRAATRAFRTAFLVAAGWPCWRWRPLWP